MDEQLDSVIAPWQRTAWTVPDLAANWGLSKDQVYRLIRGGRLRVVRVGRSYLIPADEVHRLLAEAA